MNILKYSISLVILLKFAIASESGVLKEDVIEALEEEVFKSIKRDLRKWARRTDLFDHVVTKECRVYFWIHQIKLTARTDALLLHCSSRDLIWLMKC